MNFFYAAFMRHKWSVYKQQIGMRYFILKFGHQFYHISKFQQYCDLSLITLWQQGEEVAFDALYKRYILQLLGLISQKIDSNEIAKELAQDVFLAVYLQKKDLHLIENFKAYLFAIAKNKVFRFYRHELVKQKYQRHMMRNNSDHLQDDVKKCLKIKNSTR